MDSKIHLKAPKTQADNSRFLDFIQKRKYGYMPQKPKHLSVKCVSEDRGFAAGDGILRELIFTIEYEERFFSFPVRLATPSTNAPFPVFIDISGHSDVPNKYLPAEEIINSGFAVLSFCFDDVCPRSGAPCKLASVVSKRRSLTSPSPLMLWAYAARIVTDYAVGLSYIDEKRISIVGNGAFAHAALLALIFDSRLRCAFLNNPTVRSLSSDGAVDLSLFSLGYERHVTRSGEYIYDSELLTSLAMPREVFITRGELGLSLSFGELFLKGGSQGNVICHTRGGTEYFSRKDWNTYIDYIKESALENEI